MVPLQAQCTKALEESLAWPVGEKLSHIPSPSRLSPADGYLERRPGKHIHIAAFQSGLAGTQFMNEEDFATTLKGKVYSFSLKNRLHPAAAEITGI